MSFARSVFAAALCLGLWIPSQSSGITLDMTDTFEVGPENWRNGFGPLAIAAENGPSAPGQSALEIVADGGGISGRIVGFNTSQWSGDFTAVGVEAISVDLRNTGETDLVIRLSFRGSDGPSDTYTTDPFPLAAGGGWQTALFDVRAGALANVLGIDAAAALEAIAEMRIVHSPNGGFGGGVGADGGVPFVVGTLRVDNLTAVPEPSAAWRLLSGVAGLWAIFLHRRRRQR